ncbi:MAG TPA: hypothetical protein VII06_29250 [Chloroflexota bacterium]|jgi:hypothetical protein
MHDRSIVVRRGGCTFCCLPLMGLLALAGAGLVGILWLLVLLLLH